MFQLIKNKNSVWLFMAVLLIVIPLQFNSFSDDVIGIISDEYHDKYCQLSLFDSSIEIDEDGSCLVDEIITNSNFGTSVSSSVRFYSFSFPGNGSNLKYQQWSRGTFS